MSTLTVLIISYNEERHIARALSSVSTVADRIVVVDSFSTDNTVEIAEKHGATVFSNAWPGYSDQINWALDNTGIDTDWVLRLDSDEYLDPTLVHWLNDLKQSRKNQPDGFLIARKLIFQEKWIRFGGYYPTWLLRLWRVGLGRSEARNMDEHIVLDLAQTPGKASGHIVDHNLQSISWWTAKHNKYSTLEAVAQVLEQLNLEPSAPEAAQAISPRLLGNQVERKRFYKMIYKKLPYQLAATAYFLLRYILMLGFLDSRQGLTWHFLQGFWYRYLIGVKVSELLVSIKGENNRQKIRKLLQSAIENTER